VPVQVVPPEFPLQEPEALVLESKVPWMDMDRLTALKLFWIENCPLLMGQPELELVEMPPERVAPPQVQFWKL
jgi:hypothetical protein